MGLLDYFSEAGNKLGGLLGGMPPDQSRAYNEFALGLLANSGWSKTPTTLGQNIGVAGLGALKAQDDFKRSSLQDQLLRGQFDELQARTAERNKKLQLEQNDQVQGVLLGGMMGANADAMASGNTSWQPFTQHDMLTNVLQGPAGSVRSSALKQLMTPAEYSLAEIGVDGGMKQKAYVPKVPGGAITPIGSPYSASASSVTVNNNPPFEDARLKAQQEAMGKYMVNDMYAGARNEARSAVKTNQRLGFMSKLLDNGLKTGKLAPFLAEGASFLESFGLATDAAKSIARDAQTFNAAAMDLVLQQQLAQKGPQTESDAIRLQQSVAGLEKTGDANRLLIAFAKAQNNRAINYGKFVERWAHEHRGDLYGADEAWSAGAGAKSLFEDPELAKFSDIGKQKSSYRARNPQTGAVIEWNGTDWVGVK